MSDEFYGFGDDDFDIDFDVLCPDCGAETLSRNCNGFSCEDGFIDEYEDDPLWFDPGDVSECEECHGTGVERWCPEKGCDWEWHGEVIDSDNRLKNQNCKPHKPAR